MKMLELCIWIWKWRWGRISFFVTPMCQGCPLKLKSFFGGWVGLRLCSHGFDENLMGKATVKSIMEQRHARVFFHLESWGWSARHTHHVVVGESFGKKTIMVVMTGSMMKWHEKDMTRKSSKTRPFLWQVNIIWRLWLAQYHTSVVFHMTKRQHRNGLMITRLNHDWHFIREAFICTWIWATVIRLPAALLCHLRKSRFKANCCLEDVRKWRQNL